MFTAGRARARLSVMPTGPVLEVDSGTGLFLCLKARAMVHAVNIERNVVDFVVRVCLLDFEFEKIGITKRNGGKTMEGISIAFNIFQICFDIFVIVYILKNAKKDK